MYKQRKLTFGWIRTEIYFIFIFTTYSLAVVAICLREFFFEARESHRYMAYNVVRVCCAYCFYLCFALSKALP